MIENFELVSYSRHAHNIPTALNDKIGYYDLTFVLSGELSYVIDGVPITVSDGDVILIPKGSSRIRLQGHDVCKYFSINFKSSLDSPLPVYMKACLNGEVFSFWNLIYQTAKGNSNYKESLIKDLVDALLITLKERQEKKNENRHITKIKKFISENFTEKITLQNVADCVYLNPSYCSYLVKKELGISIFEFINLERISYAKSLILEGGRSLNEISVMAGFDNYGYFARQFKEITGTSPSTYKLNESTQN